jgi:hypothetical protein
MTAQYQDHLQYDNQLYSINTEPLSSYLIQFDLYPFQSSNSACWRGYIAKWEIFNNMLFLKSLNGTISDYKEVDMSYLFKDKKQVFANWFTGTIRISLGQQLAYIHSGYDSIYEGTKRLEIKDGCLISDTNTWLTPEEIQEITDKYDELLFWS